jgi:hypothetical protein
MNTRVALLSAAFEIERIARRRQLHADVHRSRS